MSEVQNRRFAVITGGSSGIGYELAKVLLDNDFDVLLAAERGLESAGHELRGGTASVQTVTADLTTFDGNEQLIAAVEAQGKPVDVLALNAGVGVAGPFLATSLDDDLALLQLNIGSAIHLAKKLLPPMVARQQGRLLITSSIAAAMPGPYYATYAASKAFLLSFAEAIRYELRDTGVSVTALQPGPTDTDFFDRARMQDTPVYDAKMDDPAEVAREAYDALMAGREKIVTGSVKNTVQAATARVMPDAAKAALHAAQTKPKD